MAQRQINDRARILAANNIASAAFSGHQEVPRAKSRDNVGEEHKLSAGAVLFDEEHTRGFKNTRAKHPERSGRHAQSPDEARNGNQLNSSSGDLNMRPKTSDKEGGHPNHEGRQIRPSRSIGTIGRYGGGVASSTTYLGRQRQKHLADPHDYAQMDHEKRIRDLAKNKITQTHMSSKVIETWLNETLTDAGHLEIPGLILKPENKKPLTRYKIDSQQLQMGQIPKTEVDRIYRALFVYSLGFYEMLNKSLANSPQKNSFQTALWKVFSILLEYCCKTNYQMLVSKIQSEHREELDKQEEEFNECQERMFNNEKKLKGITDDLQKENDRLKKELDDRKGAYVKLTEDMAFLTKNHEEEVQLRLQFESKLNSLHALHRDVKAKYTRSTEDIFSLETFNREK